MQLLSVRKRNPHFMLRPHRPVRRAVYALLAFLLLLAVVLASYEWGRLQGGYNFYQTQQERKRTDARIAGLEQENQELLSRSAEYNRSSMLHEDVGQKLKDELFESNQTIRGLQARLSFFQGLVTPEGRPAGLHIEDFQLAASEKSSFLYRLILTQVGSKNRFVKGQVNIVVMNDKGTASLVVASGKEKKKQRPFRLKYLQTLEDDFTLPKNFKAAVVEVRLTPSGKGAKEVKRKFKWADLLAKGTP